MVGWLVVLSVVVVGLVFAFLGHAWYHVTRDRASREMMRKIARRDVQVIAQDAVWKEDEDA